MSRVQIPSPAPHPLSCIRRSAGNDSRNRRRRRRLRGSLLSRPRGLAGNYCRTRVRGVWSVGLRGRASQPPHRHGRAWADGGDIHPLLPDARRALEGAGRAVRGRHSGRAGPSPRADPDGRGRRGCVGAHGAMGQRAGILRSVARRGRGPQDRAARQQRRARGPSS